MHYNTVSVRNRWKPSGLLNTQLNPKQEVELSRYLERAMDKLLVLDEDDDLADGTGDFVITAIVELYEMITIRRFDPSEAQVRILSNNLKMDGHKLNIDDIIEISSEVVEREHTDYKDFFKQAKLDAEIRKRIATDYVVKYGTRE